MVCSNFWGDCETIQHIKTQNADIHEPQSCIGSQGKEKNEEPAYYSISQGQGRRRHVFDATGSCVGCILVSLSIYPARHGIERTCPGWRCWSVTT